jgi:hypothetical protein
MAVCVSGRRRRVAGRADVRFFIALSFVFWSIPHLERATASRATMQAETSWKSGNPYRSDALQSR